MRFSARALVLAFGALCAAACATTGRPPPHPPSYDEAIRRIQDDDLPGAVQLFELYRRQHCEPTPRHELCGRSYLLQGRVHMALGEAGRACEAFDAAIRTGATSDERDAAREEIVAAQSRFLEGTAGSPGQAELRLIHLDQMPVAFAFVGAEYQLDFAPAFKLPHATVPLAGGHAESPPLALAPGEHLLAVLATYRVDLPVGSYTLNVRGSHRFVARDGATIRLRTTFSDRGPRLRWEARPKVEILEQAAVDTAAAPPAAAPPAPPAPPARAP